MNRRFRRHVRKKDFAERTVGGTYLVYSCVCAGIGWEIMTRLSIITKRLADGIQGGRSI